MQKPRIPGLGISAIALHEPAWSLPNDWFPGIARKFVQHTGIESRPISAQDGEITLAIRAVENLQRETGCDLDDCAGIVFASPSFIPREVASRLLDERQARQERLPRAGRQLVRRLGIPNCPVHAINWFCSGYAKAMSIVRRRLATRLAGSKNRFLLLLTASRISRITDFGCKQTGPLFGDLATATLIARTDSSRYPVHFKLLTAFAEKRPAAGVFFDFHLRDKVLVPSPEGGSEEELQRLVFSLDGSGIADAAPRAMASAVAKALHRRNLSPDRVRFVVPHQAGTGIVRFTAMKLEEVGVRGEVINGMTARTGNVSSGSIPYALKQNWHKLDGLIACPTAAVGDPGKPEVSQGCILLRAVRSREAGARAA